MLFIKRLNGLCGVRAATLSIVLTYDSLYLILLCFKVVKNLVASNFLDSVCSVYYRNNITGNFVAGLLKVMFLFAVCFMLV